MNKALSFLERNGRVKFYGIAIRSSFLVDLLFSMFFTGLVIYTGHESKLLQVCRIKLILL